MERKEGEGASGALHVIHFPCGHSLMAWKKELSAMREEHAPLPCARCLTGNEE